MSTILIGVDESTRSEDAIAFGNRLAGVCSAHVVVACAFPFNDAIRDGSGGMYREALEDQAEKTVRAMRDRLDGVSANRVQIRTMPNPSAAHALHDLAQAEHAELIVVGSSHTGRMGRVAPGSTGERLLHGAPCAVAIVPDGYAVRTERSIRRIGVAYDGSDEATAAVAAAVELARALSAELEIIGVVVPHTYAASGVLNFCRRAADGDGDRRDRHRRGGCGNAAVYTGRVSLSFAGYIQGEHLAGGRRPACAVTRPVRIERERLSAPGGVRGK